MPKHSIIPVLQKAPVLSEPQKYAERTRENEDAKIDEDEKEPVTPYTAGPLAV
jgi:hypothetical protein